MTTLEQRNLYPVFSRAQNMLLCCGALVRFWHTPAFADFSVMSAAGRYCCKSPKLHGDNFPAIRRSDRRAAIFIASVALARSLTSLSSGDEVPHIFTRTSRL